jgi:hypothetical protein
VGEFKDLYSILVGKDICENIKVCSTGINCRNVKCK